MQRLDQLLASLGYGSRKEVRGLIAVDAVAVDGIPARDPGARVSPHNVTVDGEPLDHPGGLLLMLNKPAGLVCSRDGREGPSVFGLLPARWQRRNPPIASVGRLDKDTTGLLLLTDLGDLVHRLTSPRHKVPKVYEARLDRDLPPGAEAVLEAGTLLLDGETDPCAPAVLERTGSCRISMTLTEGRYHQVRRMVAALGSTVLELHRSRLGDLTLGTVPPGSYIELPINYFG